MPKGKKREATPKASKVSPASVDAPPAIQKSGIRGKPNDGSKNRGGRPIEWTGERIDALGDALVRWARLHTSCYLESFCAQNHTYPQKLTELAALSEKFSESLKVAKSSIAAHIAEATAGGEMPPAFGIFALKQRGWTDKHEVEHSGEIKGSSVIEIHLPAKRD